MKTIYADGVLPYVMNGVSDKELDEKEMDRKVSRSEDRSKYKKVQPGDLVYNMMRAWQGGFGSVTVPGMVSPAYVVARPISDFSTPFVEQLLRTPQAIEQMRNPTTIPHFDCGEAESRRSTLYCRHATNRE